MCTPCVHHEEPMSLDITPNPNSDLDSVTWLSSHVLFIRCKLIKYYLIYVRLTLTLAKVCSYSRLITVRVSRSLIVDFIFSFLFIFLFFFFYFILFYFLFLEQLGLGFICHAVTSSHKLMAKSQDWSQDWEEGSRRFQNKVTSYSMDNTCWPHVILMVI